MKNTLPIPLSVIVVLFALLFSACEKYTGELIPANTEGDFLISFPDYMKEVDDLKPNAIIQYSNSYRNIYAVVIKDTKEKESFEDYQKKGLGVLKNYNLLEMPLVTDSVYEESSNGKEIHVQLYGIMQEENIYYWHSTFESNTHYYQLVVWTRSMDRKQRYGKDIEGVIESFELVD